MHCYLCNSTSHEVRPGEPRDNADIEVLECKDCGFRFPRFIDDDFRRGLPKIKNARRIDTEAGGEAAIATYCVKPTGMTLALRC